MLRIAQVVEFLGRFAPHTLAEDWDNVGLLLGDDQAEVTRVLTCLTLTPDVAREAVELQAQLVITHHPLLFRAVKRIVASDPPGKMLLELLAARIAVYSPHTAYDSAAAGINQQLAESLELTDIGPLRSAEEVGMPGTGRLGNLPNAISLAGFAECVKQRLNTGPIQFVGEAGRNVRRVGICCGSGAELLPDAIRGQCDVFLTGEARFHTCLEAQAAGIGLVMAGHYATERPALEHLAMLLGREFPLLQATASQVESDPLRWA